MAKPKKEVEVVEGDEETVEEETVEEAGEVDPSVQQTAGKETKVAKTRKPAIETTNTVNIKKIFKETTKIPVERRARKLMVLKERAKVIADVKNLEAIAKQAKAKEITDEMIEAYFAQ